MKTLYRSDYKRIMSLIYEDQPISPQANREIVFIPERIKAIRSMGRGVAAYRQPRETIFLHQAKMMADYEDDYQYTRDIPAYMPTYESLTDEQLRGYFGWRSRLRKGNLEKAPQAFAFLYLYELINLIGVRNAEEGFFLLSDFADSYGKIDASILPYAEQWLIDYVLYNNLNPILLADRKPVIFDRYLEILLEVQKAAADGTSKDRIFRNRLLPDKKERTESRKYLPEDIFNAMRFLSGMKLKQLPACISNSELFIRVSAAVFADMCDYYRAHRKQTLLEDYVGGEINKPARFFAGAVFSDMKNNRQNIYEYSLQKIRPMESRYQASERKENVFLEQAMQEPVKEIRLSGLTVYHYEYGKWAVKTYPRDFQNRSFAELLQTIDGVIREEEGDPSAALGGLQTKWIRKLIRKALENCRREMEEEKARRVEIDLSALDGIRGNAKETMEKLITEEDLDLQLFERNEPTAADVLSEIKFEQKPDNRLLKTELDAELGTQKESIRKETVSESDSLTDQGLRFSLDEEEVNVLDALIQNRNISDVQLNGKILSVIVDSINEKLFDEFGDVVIEDGNPPMLIEDYREDLKKMFSA